MTAVTVVLTILGGWFAAAALVATLWSVWITTAKRRAQPRTEGAPPMADPLDSPTASLPTITPTAGWFDLDEVATELGIDPSELEDPAAATPTDTPPSPLSGWAQVLHDTVCDCADGADIAGHGGADFEATAAELVTNIAAALAPAVRHPVEAKVWASAGGALAASLGLAAVTLLLGRLDVIPSLLGDTPWAGALVLVLGVALPPAASLLRGYLAEHSPRPADAVGSSS